MTNVTVSISTEEVNTLINSHQARIKYLEEVKIGVDSNPIEDAIDAKINDLYEEIEKLKAKLK